MAEFSEVMHNIQRRCNLCGQGERWGCTISGSICGRISGMPHDADWRALEKEVKAWVAEHPEPVYETWFEYLLRIGVIPENAPAGGEYQWIVESIKHKHISEDIAESLKLHPKKGQT